ncbi:unnamed protein product [Paramecium octaurelia]|uniref:Guanylate cyclase domain-containing protein n=1 Tax=Paramecium octaurelia TaxID=43137 RepID=A0A8S1TYU0_PAROT|nr:unnamed protein product [Paramecium octaurelia]
MIGLFQIIANSITHQKESINNKQTQILNLQREINKIFENIEQVDINLQKLLLSQEQLFQNLGQWQSQIFQKAQSINEMEKQIDNLRIIINFLSILVAHCYLFLVCYQLLFSHHLHSLLNIFNSDICFQLLYHLNSRQMQYLELVKYMMSGIATLIAVLGLQVTEMSLYYTFSEIIDTFQISSKLHPIYDNRFNHNSNLINCIFFHIFIECLYNLFYLKRISLQTKQILQKKSIKQMIFWEFYCLNLQVIVQMQVNQFKIVLAEQYNIHKNQGNVAIVFCDICKFDQIIMEEQENIISFLDDLFQPFDKYCEICGVYKIETVVKTYMAAAGLKACESELAYLSEIQPVQRALNLAEMMITYIRSKLWGHQSQPLIGKIGIHYGRAISGVIGFHKPQFSLIGDTVNTSMFNRLRRQNHFV